MIPILRLFIDQVKWKGTDHFAFPPPQAAFLMLFLYNKAEKHRILLRRAFKNTRHNSTQPSYLMVPEPSAYLSTLL